MGLLIPTAGYILIDGKPLTAVNLPRWQKNISHVPQFVFLSDASVAENIALGVDKYKINMERVREAAKEAQIAETIEGWPNTYETLVGERGVNLSGGQRQRIGIARALYKKSQVLIFDEATSALDSRTEALVMESIKSLEKELTILIIAHRLTTLLNCDRIIELNNGRIVFSGSYNDLLERRENKSAYPNY